MISINWIFLIVGGLFEALFAMSLGKMQQTSGREMWLWLITVFYIGYPEYVPVV